MSETGTEQVKSDVQQEQRAIDASEPKAFKPEPDKIVQIAKKQLFYQRISAVCMHRFIGLETSISGTRNFLPSREAMPSGQSTSSVFPI